MSLAYSFVYNSYTVGGSSVGTAAPVGPLEIRTSRDRQTVSQEFILRGATVAGYVSAEATMLAALRAPEAALLVSNGASTIIDHDPADTTGFLLLPSVRRVEDPAVDSPTTKRWRFEVTYDLPAPSGDNYLREATTSVTFTDARQRFVTITGVYTAGGTDDARTNWSDDFATFAAAEVTRIGGGTFEKVSEGPVADDFRSEGVVAFRAVYREVLYTTSVSGLANEQITFARRRQVISSPTRVACVITFSAGVDSTTSPDLDAKWSSVRSALLTKAAALFGATTAIVERETRVPDVTGERLAGTLETILVGGSYTYRRRANVSVSYDASRRRTVTLTGVYQATDGGDGATDNYEQDIGTWATAALAAADALHSVSSSPTWELIAEPAAVWDDDDQELAFTRVYREVPHTTSASGVRNEVFGFRRISSHRHGDPGSTAPVRGVISFSCNVDKGTTDKDGLVALYTGTIRASLTGRLTAQYGGTAIVEDEDFAANPDSNTITATLRVLLKGVGSDLVDYGEAKTYLRIPLMVWRTLWSGQPDEYHYWATGHVVLAVVVATSRRLGSGDAEPEGSLPNAPPAAFRAAAGGRWKLDGPQTVERAVVEIGKGPTSAGSSTTLQTEKTTVTRLRWVSDGSAEVGRAAEDGVTLPEADSASFSDEDSLTVARN